MSTLFPKIADIDLSMKIIRAYDACDLMVANITRHIDNRDAQGDGAAEWLVRQVDPSVYTDASDVQAALAAIDAFLSR